MENTYSWASINRIITVEINSNSNIRLSVLLIDLVRMSYFHHSIKICLLKITVFVTQIYQKFWLKNNHTIEKLRERNILFLIFFFYYWRLYCFKNITRFLVQYKARRNSWMTSEIFIDWFTVTLFLIKKNGTVGKVLLILWFHSVNSFSNWNIIQTNIVTYIYITTNIEEINIPILFQL